MKVFIIKTWDELGDHIKFGYFDEKKAIEFCNKNSGIKYQVFEYEEVEIVDCAQTSNCNHSWDMDTDINCRHCGKDLASFLSGN